ncbi:MAG: hypothetical protein IPL78_27325 [Chloroflexi bacterium]|nr:hypothetical protein [Chloroflexota bacterium]
MSSLNNDNNRLNETPVAPAGDSMRELTDAEAIAQRLAAALGVDGAIVMHNIAEGSISSLIYDATLPEGCYIEEWPLALGQTYVILPVKTLLRGETRPQAITSVRRMGD